MNEWCELAPSRGPDGHPLRGTVTTEAPHRPGWFIEHRGWVWHADAQSTLWAGGHRVPFADSTSRHFL